MKCFVARAHRAAMQRYFLILALLTIGGSGFAGSPVPPLTKIVHRYIWPGGPAEAFAAKPKTLYIGGDKYSRVEEEPDPERHIHGLTICSEPDIWMINLDGRRGQHIVDPGPTYVTHHIIIGRDAPGELRALEFGKELAFFLQHHAARLEPRVIDGVRCEVSEFTQDSYRLVLCLRPDTRLPFQLDVIKDGKAEFSIRYLSYDTEFPFSSALFKPPTDITMTEAKANAQ